jgi:HEAT repeats/PBS lyase HEAT-like repeat
MSQVTSREPLAPAVAQRLTDFARACKAGARAVSLYPDGHPAIALSLGRLVDAARRLIADGPVAVMVLPQNLLVENRAIPRPDTAIGELSSLLHDHLIGELRVCDAADTAAWRTFLLLLARPTDELQAEGGISRAWTTSGGQHVQVREIDYAEVLRERATGTEAAWDDIIANCLASETVPLDEQTMRVLVEIASDPARLAELIRQIDERAVGEAGVRARTQALLRLLRHIAEAVMKTNPALLETVMQNAATAAGRLSPGVLLELLTHRYQSPAAAGDYDVVGEVVDRMSDSTIAQFVAGSVVTERGATARLAQALQALVPEDDHRGRILELAGAELAQTPFGREASFNDLWKATSDMLRSYRDESYVSSAYARELSTARTQALDVERTSDDPPERLAAWMATVTDAEIRALDLQLLLDVLRIENDAARWRDMMDPVVAHIDDLAVLGDFESAEPLVRALAAEAGPGGRADRRPVAAAAIDRLTAGPLMRHVFGHLPTVDDAGFERIKQTCQAIGPAIIRPLAEALVAEERGRAFRRLTDLLVSFGSAGRDAVERLKSSRNPSVRRTAIYLLREFGGNEALPELAPLLDDREPNVQREAIRAIVNIGTDEAYELLERALVSGTERSRDAIISALGSLRDERAVPLFCHMVRSPQYRRTMRPVYLAAIEGLGALGGAEAIAALREALYHGEWWAPFRTASSREAAATALRQVATAEATSVLEEAVERGPRGARTAARQQLALGPAPQRPRGEAAS